MSLYDDFDGMKGKNTEKVAAWSSGIKLLQSQLQLKKAATTQPKRDSIRKATTHTLAPVIDLKSKREDEDGIFPVYTPIVAQTTKHTPVTPRLLTIKDYDWDIANEYDPMWPNDYEKVVKELREQRDREMDKKLDDRDRKSHKKRKSRFGEGDDGQDKLYARPMEEDRERSPPVRTGGAAIAPPPSLVESGPPSPGHQSSPTPMEKPGTSVGGYGTSSIAAKIMAKYGFKEGQGLGKKEQGISMALQVEKTSKRGGRIIHEKEGGAMMPPPPLSNSPRPTTPPVVSAEPVFAVPQPKPEPTITEIMKSPSKVVLLRNMVGPGDVDQELEPEVMDECNTKYGDVVKVIIHELPNAPSDEAIRIFVEFKRIESAIKAVVDLNGRFFGGRQVKAGFYSVEKFANLQLLD